MKSVLILSIIALVTLAGCSVTEPMEGSYSESRFIPRTYSSYDLLYDPYNEPYYSDRYARSNTYYYNGRYYTRPVYTRPAYQAPVYVRPSYPAPRQYDRQRRYDNDRNYNNDRQYRERRNETRDDSRQRTPAVLNKNAPWKS